MKFEKINNNHVKFTFTVLKDELDHGLDHAFGEIKDTVKIDGFRKGHVTRAQYEAKFGRIALIEKALDHIIYHLYQNALTEKSVHITSYPTNIVFDDKKALEGIDFDLSFEVAIKPEVTLGKYLGVEIKKVNTDVTEDEVTEKLNQLVSQKSVLEEKKGPIALHDTAIFDFEGFKDGVPFEGGAAQNHSLEIGSGQFIPGFEEQMVGLNAGDKKDINVTFPEQYHSEDLKGKDVVFKITVHEVKSAVVPELNDEFVKSLNKEGVSTLEELKNSLRNEIKATKEAEAAEAQNEELFNKVLDDAKVDIPSEMIDERVRDFVADVTEQAKQYNLDLDTYIMYSGMTREQFDDMAKKRSEKNLLFMLVVEEIAKQEKLEASEDEITQQFDRLASMYKMTVDELKGRVPHEAIKQEVLNRKAVDLIEEKAVLV